MEMSRTYDGSLLQDTELTLLGDGAQTVDLLGYQPYVDAMVEILAQEGLQTPFSVGIFGRWGTGKSTFMNLLYRKLSKAERTAEGETGGFHAVWFQPWQFEEKEEVWKALLLSVIRYLEVVEATTSPPGSAEADRVKATLKALAVSVGKLALDKTIKTMTSGALDLKQILEAYAETVKDNSQFINTFRHQLGELKEEILGRDGNDVARLFIFIDDLDRCTPDNCIMVLEAIKLFFDLPECVFIIGIDRVVVQKGIEQKYKQNIGIHGQDYVDKLIQLPFSLPPIRRGTFRHFIELITMDFGFNTQIQALILQASAGNPRRAKRLSNCLQLTRTVAARLHSGAEIKMDTGPLDESKLALLLTLQVRYPVAYLWLTRRPIPFDRLESEWLAPADGSTDGLRADLINFLKSTYGEEVAGQTADAFLGLWKYAHGPEIGVAPFTDDNELRSYMRITGIVDDERAFSYAKQQPPTARENRDTLFSGPGDEAEPDTETTPDQEPAAPETPDEADTEKKDILSKSSILMFRWSNFINGGVITAAITLPSMLTKASRIPEQAGLLLGRIDRYKNEYGDLAAGKLAGSAADLSTITRKKAFAHARNISGVFAAVWLILVTILGSLTEKLIEILMGNKKELTAFEAFLTKNFGYDMGLKDIMGGQYAFIDLPQFFPGGALFFWTGILYSAFGLVVYLASSNTLRQISKTDQKT